MQVLYCAYKMKTDSVIVYFVVEEAWQISSGQVSLKKNNNISKLKAEIYVSIIEVKVKFTLEQATKAQRRRRSMALLFL